MLRHVSFFLVTLLCCLSLTRGAIVKGKVSSESGFQFIGRFCFDHNPDVGYAGEFDLSIKDPTVGNTLSWVIYSDESFSWPAVLDMKRDGRSCEELTQVHSDGNPLAPGKASKPVDPASSPDGWVTTHQYITQRLRPRFWYLALANCKNPESLKDIEYSIHFKNMQRSSWEIEFGSNERGMNSLYLVFLMLYTVFIGIHAYGVWRLRKELGFLHPVVKVFSLAVLFEYLSVFVNAIHFLSFGTNGVGVFWFANLGEVFTAISRVLFISALLLLAHGWTISTDNLNSTSRRTIAGILSAFLLLQIVLLSYEWASYNPELTYVTPVEYGLQFTIIACYLLFGIYFIAIIFGKSYRQEQAKPKKQLYLRLGSTYSVWLFGPPIVAIIVMLLDDWVREKIVAAVTVTVTAVGYCILAFLFWPSRATEYFRINVAPQGVELIDFAVDPLKNSLLEDGASEDAQPYRSL